MGIGNSAAPLSHASSLDHSLPLMGIGNIPFRRGGRPAIPILITPHGDRELGQHSSACLEYIYRLITPHGDRELDILTVSRFAVATILITPHGDREPLAVLAINTGRPFLITPHGDRERHLPRGRPYDLGFSLPLMGIGNPTRPLCSHASHLWPLITPHGDREPWRRNATCHRRRPSHYPSWGSGTPVRFAASPTVRTSLPLMGIGNETRQDKHQDSVHAHYPSWGSGTGLFSLGTAWSPRQLITPHGDREPEGSPDAHLIDTRLITPHGDREPVFFSNTSPVPSCSLPLMGIGNPPYSASFAPSTPRKRLKIPL